MIKSADYQFKIVIVGNSAVGKSSLLKRYADDVFQDSYLATIGVDFKFKTIEVKGNHVKLQIWDTAGQQRFRTITSAYYKQAKGIVIVFDLLNRKSFEDIQTYWFGEIEKYGQKDVEIIVLGNKTDLNDHAISSQEMRSLKQKHNVNVIQVSAKTGDQVSQSFNKMVEKLMSKSPKVEVCDEYQKSVLKEIMRKKENMKLQGGAAKKPSSKGCDC